MGKKEVKELKKTAKRINKVLKKPEWSFIQTERVDIVEGANGNPYAVLTKKEASP